ncbi:ABC transporter ATP-binding protein/permease [Prosthecomicrobium sp. N25]|uniref:ABC transporter ATP-binding protein/permease n=1 Tax=Prosthecomicrobium sp. N25 TaxID=3129254 RepID=UPI003077CE41
MEQQDEPRPEPRVPGENLLPLLGGFIGLVRRCDDLAARRRVGLTTLGLAGVIVANTLVQTRLNTWQGGFYDSIEGRDVAAFLHQIMVYVAIASTLLVLVVAQTWGVERLKIGIRRIVTHRLLDSWLVPKRTYLLAYAGEGGANPDQRIHDDTRRLAELSADLGTSLFQSGLMLVTFVGVLWILSEQVGFPIGGRVVTIPGSMVWCAVAFALAGSWLTWRFGQPLIGLNQRRYEREAEFRLGLVRVNEAAEGITLYGGEADERRAIDRQVDGLLDAMGLIARQIARLTWVTSGYGWLALVVPLFAAAPGYFSGTLSLGGLMMVVNAFNQVQSSLRWFVDNFQRIADWQAALLRVEAIEDALESLAKTNGGNGHIVVEADSPTLEIQGLQVDISGGPASLEEKDLSVRAGDRILLVGDLRTGKSMVFLALAGLWTRGTGTIRMPPRDRVMFMPERPYLPPGTLRAALAYPQVPDRFPEHALREVLAEAGIAHLGAALEREGRWDRNLSLDEQQALAFARLMLHRPDWVFLDDAASAFDTEEARRMLAAVRRRLPDTAVIATSRNPDRLGFYDRTVLVSRVRSGTAAP